MGLFGVLEEHAGDFPINWSFSKQADGHVRASQRAAASAETPDLILKKADLARSGCKL